MDLSTLSYEKLRMPMSDITARDEEIKRRIAKGSGAPLRFSCKVCGFMPCTTTEAATHIMEHEHKGEKPTQ